METRFNERVKISSNKNVKNKIKSLEVSSSLDCFSKIPIIKTCESQLPFKVIDFPLDFSIKNVKDHLLEDIAFAKHIVRSGAGKVQLLFADGMLKCSMYPTFEAFQNGWKRIYIEAANKKIKHLKQSALLAITVGLIFPFASVAGIFLGFETSPLLFWTSLASLVCASIVIAWLYRINNAPMMYAVFAPIGAAVVAKIFLDASKMWKNRKPIKWGGREYILEPNE